jgi:hypothetical protein
MVAQETKPIQLTAVVHLAGSPNVNSQGTESRATPTVRKSREAIAALRKSVELPEVRTTEEVPWADRRLHERFPVRTGTTAEIRRWGVGSGSDLASQLVDLSVSGIGVQLKKTVQSGEELEVTLWVPKRTWCIRCKGVVRWCQLGSDGIVRAGLQLLRPISVQDFEALASPSKSK